MEASGGYTSSLSALMLPLPMPAAFSLLPALE
jgi:hypothetical protein